MIKCTWCGKFISYKSIDEGKATYYFEPDSHKVPEVNEWTCEACNEG